MVEASELSLLDNGEAIMDFDIDYLLSILKEDDPEYTPETQQYNNSTQSAKAISTATATKASVRRTSAGARYGKQLSNHVTNTQTASSKAATTNNKMPSSGRRRTDAFTCRGFKRQFAKHNYHDRAGLSPDDIANDEPCHHLKSGVPISFPSLLHEMLESADALGYSEIVSWQPHGRAFHIHDPKRFAEEILPQYFHHHKISSFQRQLSLYGFTRLTRVGMDHGAYYHEYFLRKRSFLCVKLQRKRVKGTWVRKSASPDLEPDFYSMSPVDDLEVMRDTRTLQSMASNLQEKLHHKSDVDARFNRMTGQFHMEPAGSEVIAATASRAVASAEAHAQLGPVSGNPDHVSSLDWMGVSPDAIASHHQPDLGLATASRPAAINPKESAKEVANTMVDTGVDASLDFYDGLFDFNPENMYFGSGLGGVAV